MATKQLGVNTIGSIDRPSIIAGDFPRVTDEITAGEELPLGSLVYRDTDGTVKKWRSTADAVHGVVAEDLSEGGVGIAWLTGEFVGPRVVVADGSNWEDAVDSARSKSIFFKDARLAPNQ
jgi:hypothetical protein